MASNTDLGELIKKYKQGDNSAILELLNLNKRRLISWCYQILKRKEDTEDCLHDIAEEFIKTSIKKRQNHFSEGEDKIIPFLKTFAQRKAIDLLRKNKKHYEHWDIDIIKDRIADDNDFFKKNYEYEEVELAIQELEPEDQKFAIILMRYLKDKKRIMEILDLNDSQYRTIYQRVMLRLKNVILKIRSEIVINK